ncbi:response regulator [Stigmatella sp. ncwal1]|uniref:Response regulator n=1 Tax=Stigmatella ashevillensis TaxID=2995309 RepID=A0ABT5D569_9BACT|nr:response regulator [Stigmatella ashevillena]MDC0708802.1 response regulator [Stigmatella ashevillena]
MEKPRIIIVDDDRDTRELLALALESENFEVSSAANGLRLISSLQLRRPHLILLDVNMSWIDGFELCKAVKKNESFRDIPVIFISGRGEPEDRRRGMDAGAADYFVKPLDLNKLINRIRALIPVSESEEGERS